MKLKKLIAAFSAAAALTIAAPMTGTLPDPLGTSAFADGAAKQAQPDDIHSRYDFCVYLRTTDVFFTDDESQASYPRIAYADDIALTYTVNGKKYNGSLARISDSSRTYGFMLDEDAAAPPTGTFSVESLFDKNSKYKYTFTGEKDSFSAVDASWFNPLVTITKSDPRWDEQYALLPEESKKYADESGVLSFTNTDAWISNIDLNLNTEVGRGFSIYEGSQGAKPEYYVTEASLLDGDNVVAEGTVIDNYQVTFDMSGLERGKEYTVKVLMQKSPDVVVNTDVYGTMTWYPSVNSSTGTEYHLISDFSWEFVKSLPIEDDDGSVKPEDTSKPGDTSKPDDTSKPGDTSNTFTDDSADKAADVQVIAKPDIIPNDAKFSVSLDKENSTANRIAYDCSFTYNGKNYEPTDTVTVKIPVPTAMRDIADTLKVYHLQNGKYVNMSAKNENGYLVFDTDHFSVYVVTAEDLEKTADPGNSNSDPATSDKDNSDNSSSDNSNPGTGVATAAAALGIAAPAGAAALIARKKRK